MVTKPAEAALWDRTGLGSDGGEGKPLGTKIREVDAQVKELLGFSCEQFRQVVVLPQGRFRELLSSGSDKREEILRQLFRTERFRELEVVLSDRARSVRRQMDELERDRKAQLGLVEAEDDEALTVLTEAAETEVRSAAAVAEDRAREDAFADETFKLAAAAAAAHQAVADARMECTELATREPEMKVEKDRLEKARRAEKVSPVAHGAAEATGLRGQAEAEAGEAQRLLAEARQVEEEAGKFLAREKERQEERKKAAERVRELEGLADKAKGLLAAEAEHQKAVECAQAARRAQNEADQAYEAAARLQPARLRLDQARVALDRCARLARAATVAAEAASSLEVASAREADVLVGLRQAETACTEAEVLWRSGRAAALASTLEPGEACPVCGSTDHPAPASMVEPSATDEEIEAARAAAAEVRERYERARGDSETARRGLAVAETELEAVRREAGSGGESSVEVAEKAVADCQAELALFAQLAGVESLPEGVSDLAEACDKGLEQVSAVKDFAAAAVVEAESELVRVRTLVEERATLVPQELRDEGALASALESASATQQALETALAEAQELAGAAEKARIGRQEGAEGAHKALRSAVDREVRTIKELDQALTVHGFENEDDWRSCCLDESQCGVLRTMVEDFRDRVQQAKGRLEQAEKAAKDLPVPDDLESLRDAAEQAKKKRAEALDKQSEARQRLMMLRGMVSKLAQLDERAGEIRRSFEVVGALADAAEGKNAGRVSFQRWVLGVYLDEVLSCASRRLHVMSKGRFRLERQKEASGRGRPSGLDLAVFDEFSGAARPAVTLSGGESFLAALSLALGLAETVQEHSAAIPLETIFVDEGFGALDADALELAVDALMELQSSGRLVGVISHVPELRSVIPARLEVRGGQAGSSTAFVVP